MGADVTAWGAEQYLRILYGLAPPPAGFWIALCSDEPGVLTDGAMLADLEPADPAYQRQFIALGAENWSDPGIGGYITNLAGLDYGIPGMDWNRLSHYVYCDAGTGGNVYSYGEFNQEFLVTTAYSVQIPPGALATVLAGAQPPIVST